MQDVDIAVAQTIECVPFAFARLLDEWKVSRISGDKYLKVLNYSVDRGQLAHFDIVTAQTMGQIGRHTNDEALTFK